MRQVSVRLTRDVVERLDDAARRAGTSRSELVQSWCLEAAHLEGGVFAREEVDRELVASVRESGHELNWILAQIHSGESGYQRGLISALEMVVLRVEGLPRIDAMNSYERFRDAAGLSVRVSVAVSSSSVDLFDASALASGMDRSKWMRDCVLHGVGLDRYRVASESCSEAIEVVRRQVSLFVQAEMVGGVQAAALAQRGLDAVEKIA